jgi:cyclopropane fatty-acyl-phospholipid synthase-like methyltransferase
MTPEEQWWDDLEGDDVAINAWGDPPYDAEVAAQRILDCLRPDVGQRILDLGCGPGRTAAMVADMAAVDVVGVDVAPNMIKIAELLFPQQAWKVGDGRRIPHAKFDHAYSITMFEHIPHVATVAYLDQLYDRLPVGGRLLFTHTPGYSPNGPHHHQCGHVDTPRIWCRLAGFEKEIDVPPSPLLDAETSWHWYAYEKTS